MPGGIGIKCRRKIWKDTSPMDNLVVVARSITGAGQDKGLKIGNLIYTFILFLIPFL